MESLKVSRVEIVSGEHEVFDIQVEADESFIVNGAVVHNCSQCAPLDHNIYALDKGPRPPIHPNDRCTTVPVLADKYQKLMEGVTRPAVVDGKVQHVPGSESFYDWLKRQDAAFQEQTIGIARAKLLRDGGLSAKRFAELQLDRNFKPLTLAELREIEPIAFKRAGL